MWLLETKGHGQWIVVNSCIILDPWFVEKGHMKKNLYNNFLICLSMSVKANAQITDPNKRAAIASFLSEKRVFSSIRSIVNLSISEEGINCINAFSKTYMPDKENLETRKPIPVEAIKKIQLLCRDYDADLRWLIALLSDTGMRLGEGVGMTCTLETLKAQLSPERYYSRFLNGAFGKPTGQGWHNWNGLCPFHKDTRAGSFVINRTTGSFKCFSCGETGVDIIAFRGAS